MDPFMGLLVVGTSIWMATDAARLGYDKRDVKGIAAIGPAGWFFAGLLLWIVAFPLYLVKRNELKAAGLRRRQWALGGHVPGYGYGQNPPVLGPPYGAAPPNAPGQHPGPVPPHAYGQHPAPMPPHGHGQHPTATPPHAYGHPPSPHAYGQQPSPPPDASFDVVEEITKLGRLRDAGILTDAEFQQKKTEILARM